MFSMDAGWMTSKEQFAIKHKLCSRLENESLEAWTTLTASDVEFK